MNWSRILGVSAGPSPVGRVKQISVYQTIENLPFDFGGRRMI